jgi:hypothetical protein
VAALSQPTEDGPPEREPAGSEPAEREPAGSEPAGSEPTASPGSWAPGARAVDRDASRHALKIEASATTAFLLAALAVGREPGAMLALVVAIVAARTAAHGRGRRAREAALYAGAALLGGLNDWVSVDVVGLYHYEVPSLWPALTTVPEWMWLGWGLVLRLVLAVSAALGPAGPPGGLVRPRWARALVEVALVVATRQSIYRNYAHPWLSWLPFALALALYAVLLGLDRRERRLVLVLATIGPLAEVLLIEGAGVHAYALGWLGGVPLWIVLWWVLGALVWKDAAGALDHASRSAPRSWATLAR